MATSSRIIALGEGLYAGSEPCRIRVVSRRGSDGSFWYLEFGGQARSLGFGVRLGPFPSLEVAKTEASRKTRGTVAWGKARGAVAVGM